MKKIIAIILALLMTIVSAGCAGNNAANDSNSNTQTVTQAVDPKSVHHKIGVVEIATGNAVAITEQYFSEYLAPYYNCEFVFSEACSTTDAVITFMENCADMGVEAIICNYNYDTEQLTQKAADLGMYFCENLNRNATSEAAYTGGYDNFCGTFAANQSSVAKLFHDWIVDTLDTSEDHGFIVTSGWAYRGNEQHLKITEAMLNALQEVYGLTFDDEIETYLASSAPMHATNDKNVEIYIYQFHEIQVSCLYCDGNWRWPRRRLYYHPFGICCKYCGQWHGNGCHVGCCPWRHEPVWRSAKQCLLRFYWSYDSHGIE